MKQKEEYLTCGACNGHYWLVWLEPTGYSAEKQAVVKPCKFCNKDGQLKPRDLPEGYDD